MDGEVILTADDIVRAGACRGGVAKVLRRLAGTIAAAMPVSAILRLLGEDERGYVTKAAQLDGYGDGYCDGDGDGYGYCDGYGSGYSDGYSDGYGDGYGHGYGDGYGDGDGDGNGYGYAYAEER